MPTVDVVDLNNQKVSEVELADDVFGGNGGLDWPSRMTSPLRSERNATGSAADAGAGSTSANIAIAMRRDAII